MEKIRQSVSGNNFVKYYRCKDIIRPVAFLEDLAAKGWKYGKVFMKRDAELDMQFDIGYYTIEELRQLEKALAYGPACQFTLNAYLDDHMAEIHFSDDSKIIYILTVDPEFELE